MIEPWPNTGINQTSWISNREGVKYALFELGTVLEALTSEQADKVTLHTDYGKVCLYSGDMPDDIRKQMWAWPLRADHLVVRCRIVWRSYKSVEIEVYGEAEC